MNNLEEKEKNDGEKLKKIDSCKYIQILYILTNLKIKLLKAIFYS